MPRIIIADVKACAGHEIDEGAFPRHTSKTPKQSGLAYRESAKTTLSGFKQTETSDCLSLLRSEYIAETFGYQMIIEFSFNGVNQSSSVISLTREVKRM